MFYEAETWVALAFIVFIGVLIYMGAHKSIAKSLDDRAVRIKAELDEARKLREDAARLLADYERKRQEAENEAKDILAVAQAEAERMAADAQVNVEEFVTRRTQMAEAKIALAETQAAADVRAAAADAAVAAAERILSRETKGERGDVLVAQGIDDVRKRLN